MSDWTAPGSDRDDEPVLPPPPPEMPAQWSNPAGGPPLPPASFPPPPPHHVPPVGPPQYPGYPSYPQYPGYPNAAYFDASQVQTPEQALAARGSNVRLVGILSLFTCPVVGILAIVWSFRVRADASRVGYAEPRSNVTGRIAGACGIVVSVLVWIAVFAAQRAQM
jgi:hypothetical protein